jgi:predicted ATPase
MTDGKTLPPEVLQQIIAKTDGVPLFVEEMTKAILESGALKAVDNHYELTGSLSTFAIPATLQDSLMARLDRLMTGKVIAQLGATIGRQFSYAHLQAVAQLNERTLHEELHRLVEAELLYQRGVPPQATYTFKHALIQDTAYESLLKSTRQHYHQRIAQVLEAQFPETVEAQPELLAHHYTEAGLAEKAVHYWYHAGQSAIQRSAHAEATAHLTRGLEVLASLPDTAERLQYELALQTTLGPVLMATKGYAAPEVEHTYSRARQLCAQLGETPQLFQVLLGLRFFYQVRGALQSARELGEQLLHLAQQMHSRPYLVQAHAQLGHTLCFRGEFVAAREHVEQAMSLYDAHQHRAHALLSGLDPGVISRCADAWALWPLGYPDQALARAHAALALASALAHPQSVDQALGAVAQIHQYRREADATREQTESAIAVASERGFHQRIARGTVLRGWALAMQGKRTEGMAQLCQGLAAYRATGAEAASTYYLALLAEVHAQRGQTAAGLSVVGEALALVNRNGERWWEAELLRLKGALLLQQTTPDTRQAEACFQQALDIARRQQAKSWELRAATSLGRLWQQQGKHAEAYELLAPIYGWFTEGFDTADLQEAKTLLEALA